MSDQAPPTSPGVDPELVSLTADDLDELAQTLEGAKIIATGLRRCSGGRPRRRARTSSKAETGASCVGPWVGPTLRMAKMQGREPEQGSAGDLRRRPQGRGAAHLRHGWAALGRTGARSWDGPPHARQDRRGLPVIEATYRQLLPRLEALEAAYRELVQTRSGRSKKNRRERELQRSRVCRARRRDGAPSEP